MPFYSYKIAIILNKEQECIVLILVYGVISYKEIS
ncbi:hypothetical protein HH_1139 [Helicobacter hepaticus ATCC 51449]|uniref:Uncharacterized protein n=1 Tax=Helicobacter hepaticus (strain ATCC 51449 / 3B1) TaxID=235279 RepID=Q7VH28_HELHP|nr:hypothetical protein HH_1139 [Helicobacter hepaticus ATCC 51449]